jgi:hypothetical protein
MTPPWRQVRRWALPVALASGLVCGALHRAERAEPLLVTWDSLPIPVQTWTVQLARVADHATPAVPQRLVPLAPAACRALVGEALGPAVRWCAPLACPAPGTYGATLHADDGLASAVWAFSITRQHPCHLERVP